MRHPVLTAAWTIGAVIWAAAVLGVVFLASRELLRYPCRLAWYRLTGRMPGKCPRRDPFRLTDEDRAEFGGITILYRERGTGAGEPRRARRQP